MKNKSLITFAGAMGSSKTPIAYHLSCKLGLPIFNNDAIRTEVIEDLGVLDVGEYERRRNSRLEDLGKRGVSFIYDASVDRDWALLKENVAPLGYRTFVISMDLGQEFLASLYARKMKHNQGYAEFLARIESSLADHKSFLEKHGGEVSLHIDDASFADRLEMSYIKVKDWLEG